MTGIDGAFIWKGRRSVGPVVVRRVLRFTALPLAIAATLGLAVVGGRLDAPVADSGFAPERDQSPTEKRFPFSVELTIAGPSLLYSGDSARFTAKARYSDGSIRDVTTQAKWSSSSESSLIVSAAGTARAVHAGNAVAVASYGGQIASASVRIIAPQ